MHNAIWIINKLEDLMVLNNVTKFHKILIKTIRFRERTWFQMVNFHKQRAITPEGMVQNRPLSNLKKDIMVLNKQCDQISQILSDKNQLKRADIVLNGKFS